MKTLSRTILLLAALAFPLTESIKAETEKPAKDTKHVSVTTHDASQEKSAGIQDRDHVVLDIEPDTTDRRPLLDRIFGYRPDDPNLIKPYPTLIFRTGAGYVWWNDTPGKTFSINGYNDTPRVLMLPVSISWVDPVSFSFIPQRIHTGLELGLCRTVLKDSSTYWEHDGSTKSIDWESQTSLQALSMGIDIYYDLSRSFYGRAGFGVAQWKSETKGRQTAPTPTEFKKSSGMFITGYFQFHAGYRYFITKHIFAGIEAGSVITAKFQYPSAEAALTCGISL